MFSYNLILNGDAVAADAANFFPFKPVPFARRVSVIVYQQEPKSEKHKGHDKKGVFSFEDHLCIVLLKNSMIKKETLRKVKKNTKFYVQQPFWMFHVR